MAMKKLVTFLNILLGIYFFGIANFLFWLSILAIFVSAFAKPELLQNPWLLITNMLFAPFFIYGSINYFRKNENKYNYNLILLSIFWLHTQIFRFFFITNNMLEKADLSNFLLFIVSFAVVYLTRSLSKSCS